MGKTGVRGTFAALVAAVLCGCGSEPDFVTVDGTMLGTTLHVVADVKGVSRQRLYAAVMELDREAKASMSIYDSTSLVSRLNRNETDSVDRHIAFNLHLADSIGALSDGRYDVTVKPLVEAWGFAGRERAENPNVDSILEFVGREKVRVEGGRLVKDDPRVQLDFNSVAKGYTVDLLAGLVEKYGAENYIVDIGGEVRCRGLNRQGRAWRIGVETPFDGNMSDGEYLQKRIQMTGGGLATSGNYRNYYYHEGKKYAHTIDPHTGYPALHNLLSATVIARDCMSADAYATAFMVMGLERAKAFVEARPDLDAYFIYADSAGSYQTYMTQGMERYVAP